MRKILSVATAVGLLLSFLALSPASLRADSGALPTSSAESASAVIAAGRGFHCWVQGGGAKCIGLNDVGQLGDGSNINRTAAVNVTGLSSGVIAIAAGDAHVCALITGGSVKCWGSNNRGQLGDGSTVNSSSPVQVSGLTTGVVRVEAGLETTCAITSVGRALCWGNNQTYGAGSATTDGNADNEFDPVLAPTQVTGLSSGVVAISISGERTSATVSVTHGCAVLEYGDLKCWGSNSSGQAGVAGSGPFSAPQQVVTGTQMAAVSNGALHTCAVSTSGAVMCWGANDKGQLANGTSTAVASGTIVAVAGATSGIVQVSSGRYTSCAITSAGGLLCWGDNIHGGISPTPTRSTITSVTTPYSLTSGISAVSLSEYATCALFTNGDLKCWGTNSYGQTGDGYQLRSLSPVPVHSGVANSTPLTGIQSLGSSQWTNCGVNGAGALQCWGYNYSGELGIGTQIGSPQPVNHQTLTSGVQSVEGKYYLLCGILTNTEAKCWGQNTFGVGATGDTTSTLTTRSMLTAPSTPVSGVTDLGVGQYHSCLVANGAALCTGRNTNGALGDGSVTNSNYLVQVSGLSSGVEKVSAGLNFFSCAVLTDGTGRCWGNDANGQLGNGSGSGSSSTPTAISGLSGAVDISSGENFSCALKSDGTVMCWGYNQYGQLGDGTNTNSQAPVQVSGLSGAVKLVAGPRNACAIVANGAMKCWGWNYHGVFADGTTTDSNAPVSASGVTGLTSLTMGTISSCGLFAAGAVKCWGSEQSGQLGNNRMQDRVYAAHNILATGLSAATQLPALQILAPTTTTTTTTTIAASPTTVPGSSQTTQAETVRIDNRIYTTAPSELGRLAMINLVSASSLRTRYLRSTTPKTCVAAGRAVVTIAPGDCVVLIRSLKSGEVLKRWKTTVVASDNGFGSTIRVAPSVMFSKSSPVAMKNSLSVVVKRVSGARAALVVGHTGILTGNTQENRVLSVKRAKNVSNELKQVAVVSFVGLGGDVPLSTRMSETAQAQNRRVVIYFVP